MQPTLGSLSLQGAGDIAQFVIAGAALIALAGAAWQIHLARMKAKRGRVYDYADRFNDLELLAAISRYRKYWNNHDFAAFKKEPKATQQELNYIPNLIEEIAWLYNRRILDRNTAAELLGTYVERLWKVTAPHVADRRAYNNYPELYAEWEEMQRDTPRRQAKANRKANRRRARRHFFRGY